MQNAAEGICQIWRAEWEPTLELGLEIKLSQLQGERPGEADINHSRAQLPAGMSRMPLHTIHRTTPRGRDVCPFFAEEGMKLRDRKRLA